ncbi:BofC C-terminal domain-containing protein [Anaerobacillus sp. MEB173]|uniref:BofC C-terminal domain-containing protein n=1 Tax=Anaerobacillus sp. MEB173 TaxID=3383345 RepID=UPI003F8EC06B
MNIRFGYGIVSVMTILFVIFLLLIISVVNNEVIAITEENHPPTEKNENAFEVMGPKSVEVILQRVYLDGEVSEEIVEEVIWSMEDFWAFYENWNLVDQSESQVIFQQEVDDISPLLKINGYFGISPEGVLRIYEGKPNEEKVIHSFFQINTKKLKSHQQSELQEGIPVLSRDHYEKVIQTMKKYAVNEL